jgi:hypothetical protein
MSKPLNTNTSLQSSASLSWAVSIKSGKRWILPLESNPCSALALPLPPVCPASMVQPEELIHRRRAIVATVRP